MSEDDPYASNASLIDLVLNASCRAHRLAPDHADEFRSWAQLRLLEHDQAILRKFAERSTLRTFLVTVVERLFLDWRNHEWGKWRPSSEARRQGEVAIELERLVLRDGCPLGEAVQVLVSRGLAADAEACHRAWERLPRRPRRQRVDEEHLVERPAPAPVLDSVEAAELRERRGALLRALEAALAELPEADQAILRLRYWGGVPVSRLAVTTGEDQKQLYRRFERILRDLRARLLAHGMEAELSDVFEGFDPDERGATAAVDADDAENADTRPSHLRSAGGTHG